MAQRVQIVSTCDLDDGEVPAVETVTFGVDGVDYQFELCEDHLAEFRTTVGGYALHARRTGGEPVGRHPRPAVKPRVEKLPPAGKEGTALIRAWAKANGYRVSDRGRVGADIKAAYVSAH